MIYAEESISDTWDEMLPLMKRHYEELAMFGDAPFNVDKGAYTAPDAAGWLRFYTMRAGGELRGYSTFIVAPHHHYHGKRVATQDVIYIAPEVRGAGHGLAFIEWCDGQIIGRDNVDAIIRHSLLAHNFGPLLERVNYVPTQVAYVRRIK